MSERTVKENLQALAVKKVLQYANGVARPVSISVDTFGTGRVSDRELESWVCGHFDFRPAAIIEQLDLRRPIYLSTAAYGHFGKSQFHQSWEELESRLLDSARTLLHA